MGGAGAAGAAGAGAAAATGAAAGAAATGITAAQVMAGLSVVTAATSMYAQQQTAKAQGKAIQTQADAERDEIGAAAEEDIGDRIRVSREKRARAMVAAGESGALGASFAASINQSLQDQNMDIAKVSKNSAFAQRGVTDRAGVALSQLRSPSALEAGLQIAGSGIQGYSAGLEIDKLK